MKNEDPNIRAAFLPDHKPLSSFFPIPHSNFPIRCSMLDVLCSMFIFLLIPQQSIRRKNNAAPMAFPLKSKDLFEGAAAIPGMVFGVNAGVTGKSTLNTRRSARVPGKDGSGRPKRGRVQKAGREFALFSRPGSERSPGGCRSERTGSR